MFRTILGLRYGYGRWYELLEFADVFTFTALTVLFVFGLVQLGVGYVLGCTIGARKLGGHYKSIMQRLRDSSKRTTRLLYGVREDISRHREEIGKVNRELVGRKAGNKSSDDKYLEKMIITAISKIVAVNQQLENRLSRAEMQMEEQADQLMSQLSEARTDSLTGLANRRVFDSKLEERLARWNQERSAFSLVLIDVDFFKNVNDRYGHPAGDAVLRDLAQLMQKSLKGIDVPARIGGEEFAVIIPHIVPPDLFQIMQSLHDRVNESSTMVEGEIIRVTVSMGLVTVREGDSVESLVKRADLALYDAKHAGRNVGFFRDGRMSYQVVPQEVSDAAEPADPPLELNAPIRADAALDQKDCPSLSVDSELKDRTADSLESGMDEYDETSYETGGCDNSAATDDSVDYDDNEISPIVSELCDDVRRRLAEIVREEPPE